MSEKEKWEEEKKGIEEEKTATELAREHDKIRLLEFEVNMVVVRDSNGVVSNCIMGSLLEWVLRGYLGNWVKCGTQTFPQCNLTQHRPSLKLANRDLLIRGRELT